MNTTLCRKPERGRNPTLKQGVGALTITAFPVQSSDRGETIELMDRLEEVFAEVLMTREGGRRNDDLMVDLFRVCIARGRRDLSARLLKAARTDRERGNPAAAYLVARFEEWTPSS